MTTKQWNFKPLPATKNVVDIQTALQVDEITAKLLTQRGIDDFDGAKSFFRPQITDLHNPFLMKDMQKAIDALQAAMQAHTHILIYGDYDVDGTTAVALVYSYLGQYYDKLTYYIPNRHKEGYGLSIIAIDWAVEHNIGLIITFDCGITAIDQVAYARSKNIDIIITDHHRPADQLPAATAILDAKQKDCMYPYDELCGCGVAFKLCQAFAIHNQLSTDELYKYLDLVAVSIASDIVPISGENRILAHFGLKKLSENPSPGLKAIKELCFPKTIKELTISDIVFKIGPRINAAGRMGDANRIVRLLTATETLDAESQAEDINHTNDDRREIDSNITQKALEKLMQTPNFHQKKSTVVYGETWHKGVIGIVASRMIEHYYRPTIVFTQKDDLLTGSARSVQGFDVYNAIRACHTLVEQFGGHKYAAGLTIKKENFDAFATLFEQTVAQTITSDQLMPSIDVDLTINLNQITPKLIRILKQFAPFGPHNMQPVFCSKGVYANNTMRIVGNGHLQLYIEQEDSDSFAAIAFNQANHHPQIAKGLPFDVCYTIDENTWNDKTTVKLNIKDVKLL
jgi:single-stranded-DNA-specific exonuclease